MNFKSKRDLSCMLSETSISHVAAISHVDVMNVLDILTLIDSRLCSDFSTATSVYFGVESSKLGQAVSGKWGGHGVDDGGRREGGRAASL